MNLTEWERLATVTSVKFTDANDPDGDSKVYFNVAGDIAAADVTDGKGVGKDAIAGGGQGLTFQIGANGVEDQRVTLNVNDMSSTCYRCWLMLTFLLRTLQTRLSKW